MSDTDKDKPAAAPKKADIAVPNAPSKELPSQDLSDTALDAVAGGKSARGSVEEKGNRVFWTGKR